MIQKQSNREEYQSGEYLPDEEEYEKYLEMQDYYAEKAMKEMEEAEYLPDEEEYEKMLALLEVKQDGNSDTGSLVSKQKKESTSTKALSVDVEFIEDESSQTGTEFDYISFVHNETLAKILKKITPVNLIKTITQELKDELIKYQDASGNIKVQKVPNRIHAVAIMFELKKVAYYNGFHFAEENGMIYAYTRKYWEKIDFNILKRFLTMASIKLGFYSIAEAQTEGFIKILFNQFPTTVHLMKRKKDSSTVLINLHNGTYEVTPDGMRMREHNPEDFLTYILPFAYKPDAKAPLFMEYLTRVLPDTESQQVLQEFHGYVFTRDLKLEKALLLYGTGANGKSVQFEITKALLGSNNMSTKGLGELTDRDSGNANRTALKDKLLNYGSEINAKQVSVDIFKRLVSGDPARQPPGACTLMLTDNQCKFIFNANSLPDTKEHTDAFYRRFLILPYTQRIPDEEMDPELPKKIIASELSGIFNWVLEGLERLLKQKDFSECAASIKAVEEYKKESNYIQLFTEDEHLVADLESKMSIGKLYDMYRYWAKDKNGISPLEKPKFSKELELLEYERYRTAKERGFRMRVKEIEE